MGRPRIRDQRQLELADAYIRVLAEHGLRRATIAALAHEAGVAPGLIHHHFVDKAELFALVFDRLLSGFRRDASARIERGETHDPLTAYIDAALSLRGRADTTAARAWVAVLAEAVREPDLHARVRRAIDRELLTIERLGGGQLDEHDAAVALTFIVGALVMGAFAPRKTRGFAARALHRLLASRGRAATKPR